MATIEVNIRKEDIEYFNRLEGKLGGVLKSIETEVSDKLLRAIKGATPVGLKYNTRGENKAGGKKKRRGKVWKRSGELKKSWKSSSSSKGSTIQTSKPYAAVLEEGAYPGTTPSRLINQPAVGKGGKYGIRTVAAQGGIFSTQAVGGIIEPFLEGDRTGSGKVLDRIIKQVVNQLIRELRSVS